MKWFKWSETPNEKTAARGYRAASSADGSRLIICNSFGTKIYTSTNFGISWALTNFTGKAWVSVASSADGCELLAGNNQGEIWIYHATPSPQLNLAPSSNDLALSWLVPSTNFVLQQNSDLTTTNWVTLTNTPTFNLTNLQNQIMLSPTNSSGFFRLMAQ